MPAIQFGKRSARSDFDKRANDKNKPGKVSVTRGKGKIGPGSNGNSVKQSKKHVSSGRGQ